MQGGLKGTCGASSDLSASETCSHARWQAKGIGGEGSCSCMYLIKIIVCRTLRSFQSVFYARCNAPRKECFLASFLMGTFAGRSMFPTL